MSKAELRDKAKAARRERGGRGSGGGSSGKSLPHLHGWLRTWETGLFRDGWKRRWLLLEQDKLFIFRGESELEHLRFVDLSNVTKVAPVENAFGTDEADKCGRRRRRRRRGARLTAAARVPDSASKSR